MLLLRKLNQICGWVWDKTEIQFEQTVKHPVKNNDDNQHTDAMPPASSILKAHEKKFVYSNHSFYAWLKFMGKFSSPKAEKEIRNCFLFKTTCR